MQGKSVLFMLCLTDLLLEFSSSEEQQKQGNQMSECSAHIYGI